MQRFADPIAECIFNGRVPKGFPADVARVARRKLRSVVAARKPTDLKEPKGNRLKALKGNRKGQYSVRINDKYRICFRWRDGKACAIEVVDYH